MVCLFTRPPFPSFTTFSAEVDKTVSTPERGRQQHLHNVLYYKFIATWFMIFELCHHRITFSDQ